jgi:hypothetical protein
MAKVRMTRGKFNGPAPAGGFAPLFGSPARLSRGAPQPRHPAGGPNLPPGGERGQSSRPERAVMPSGHILRPGRSGHPWKG